MSRWPFSLAGENKVLTTEDTEVTEVRKLMKTIFIILVLGLNGIASATTYYVSSGSGNDANSGTSAATAWKTIAKVNSQTFQAGDSILFKRGDVWNESLVPPSSGAAGNPIAFDAYGTGAPPNLTGYYSVPSSAWVQVTGNAWKAPVPATFTTVSFCLFGSVWGQKVAASSSNLTAQWNFYLANGYVYVYSVGKGAHGTAEYGLRDTTGWVTVRGRRVSDHGRSGARFLSAVCTAVEHTHRGRGYGRSVAEVVNSTSVASLQNGADDGIRGLVRTMKSPSARTQADCENAALAILDDAGAPAWSGTYRTWSDFLPGGAADIFPGDAVAVDAPSRNAVFSAIVRKVNIDLVDPADDRGIYSIEFANDAAPPLALRAESSATAVPLQDVPVRLSTGQVGSYYLADLTNAQITQVTSTTVQVDVGMPPPNGCGIEVRSHDYGWGGANDRNLLGRFNTQTFNLPRLARTQNYFLRLYDDSAQPRYSRYAAALHIDYPL